MSSWPRRAESNVAPVSLASAIDAYLGVSACRARSVARPRSRPTGTTCAASPRRTVSSGTWSRGPEAVVRFLADSRKTRDRPAGRVSPRPACDGGRRACAASTDSRIGDELIRVDVAAQLDLPRQARRLPETLSVDETARLLDAAALGDEAIGEEAVGVTPAVAVARAIAIRDRALLELLYAAGLRISEALGLDREDLSLDGAFVRVDRQGRPRAPRAGRRRGARLALRRYLEMVRARTASTWRHAAGTCVAGRLFLGPRGGRDWRASRRGSGGQGGGRPGGPVRSRSARTPCGTRSRRICSRAEPTCASSRNCSDMRVSARPSCTRTHRRTDQGGLRPSAPAGMRRARTPWLTTRRACSRTASTSFASGASTG